MDVPHSTLLQDLAVVMLVAAMVTLLFHRLRQPVVLGYILAGAIIGPHTPPFGLIVDLHSIETLAELGVIFLMFSLGLHFSIRQLRQVGATALVAASFEIVLMIWAGYQMGRLFGWSQMNSLFLGAILSISSTTIIVKALEDLGRTKEEFSRIIFGILIVEDILAIAMITLLSSIALTGSLAAGEVLLTVGQLAIFLAVVLVVGLIAVPPLLRYVAQCKSDEMMLVTVLGLCFGVSLLALKMKYSVALGAFVIGTVIGEARESGIVRRLTEPVRDMFSAVFFVAIGMMINPQLIVEYAWPIAIITVAVVVGKVLTCSLGTFIAGHDTRTSFRVGMGLAQIGEFSFIIASLGLRLNVTADFLYPIAVTVSVVTTLLTPYLIRASDPLVNWFDRVAPKSVVSLLELYSQRLQRMRGPRRNNLGVKLARRWVVQIVINIMLISGVFLAAVSIAPHAEAWWPVVPAMVGGAKGLVWLAAAVVTLPGLIAAVRKLQALAMLVSELSVTSASASTSVSRTILARFIFVVGAVAIGFWVLLLSSTLLPTGPALIALLLIVSLLTIVLWRLFIQVHAKAQIALLETLATPSHPEEHPQRLPLMLRDAELATVTVAGDSVGSGKLIRELELRSRTGATVIGIERGERQVINPGPDEELQTGDRVLLFGNTDQLAAARELLAGPGGAARL